MTKKIVSECTSYKSRNNSDFCVNCGEPRLSHIPTEKDKMIDLADRLAELTKTKADQEEALKKTNKEIKNVSEDLTEIMELRDVQNFNHAGKLFYQYPDLYLAVVSPEDLKDYLKKHDAGGLIKETVHAGTLKTWFKDVRDAESEKLGEDGKKISIGEELRDGILKVTDFVTVRMRKGK